MAQVRNYEDLIRELFDGVVHGWGYDGVKDWLMGKGVKELELAQWLREHGADDFVDEFVGELACLAYWGEGDLAKVAEELMKGWKPHEPQEKEEWEKLFSMGNFFSSRLIGSYEEAIASYEQAIQLNPNSYQIWSNRGLALKELGRYEEAVSDYNRAIQINPNDDRVLSDLGIALRYLGRCEEAISSYDRAIAIQSGNKYVWTNRGFALEDLGRYEEAISSYDRAIAIDPDNDEAFYSRGISLCELGRYEEAISSYERSTTINSNNDRAWFNRGLALRRLGRCEEAIHCYERSIKINPDKQEAWHNRGFALFNLEQYEEAIHSYEQSIKINPDFHESWSNRGSVLKNLGRYEEAIASFDRAIEIKPDFHFAWSNRGIALKNLGRYEEAIASYDRVIEIKPDYHDAWYGRGVALKNLGRYEEAIASYDRAIEIKPDDHIAWYGRGVAIRLDRTSYRAEIEAYQEAFQHIHYDTHPEGYGFLQYKIGLTYHDEGNNQLLNYQRNNPHLYYGQALTHYHKALEVLTPKDFPKLRLDTLIDTAKVYLAQHNKEAAHQYKTEAFEIFQDLLNAQPTFEAKKRLQLQYTSLRQLDVDLFIANGDNINALVAAELEKNNRLTWLLSALAEKTISPSYVQMHQLLGLKSASTTLNIRGLDGAITLPLAKNSPTGIIYWHLSPDSLTTFILTANDSQPLVWESDRRKQAQQLAKWIDEWDTQYCDYGSKKAVANQSNPNDEAAAKAKEQHPWRKNLLDYLAELQQILEIDQICVQLPSTLTHLILIPHGDLHRFPLHTLFLSSAKLPNLQSCTYLPSIQIGLNLQRRSAPNRGYTPLLSVEDPKIEGNEPMRFAPIESAIVRHLLQTNAHIDPNSANLATVENALRQPHSSFHFTGHAAYNSCKPEDSALALTDAPFTAKHIAQLNLSSYNLITLAACETAITGRANINTEYIGLTSAFLQAGAANILSTLWQVDEISNAWFTIYFHQQLLAGHSPAVALTRSQIWLKTVTWQDLADWLLELKQLPHLKIGIVEKLQAHITNTLEDGGTIGLDRPSKYIHPYHWAAFTLTGRG
jgi:tetratricopeptide (TPR) repeat protein